MSDLEAQSLARRVEAERLIDLAKGLLVDPAEEIAAIYLDHALDALRAIPAQASRMDARSASASWRGSE